MGLNKSTGNMYSFVTHTWNTVKGKCPHDCSYCYMKRWGEQKPVRFDEKELPEFERDIKKEGEGLFIFVGSSCDMWANGIPKEWIIDTLKMVHKHDNKYLLQTKNPARYSTFGLGDGLNTNFILGTTIETNRYYNVMGKTPLPGERAKVLSGLRNKKFITIEPIIDFDVKEFAEMINWAGPDWVNIGADSGNNNLPEPPKEKIEALIKLLNGKITIKKNMKRIK